MSGKSWKSGEFLLLVLLLLLKKLLLLLLILFLLVVLIVCCLLSGVLFLPSVATRFVELWQGFGWGDVGVHLSTLKPSATGLLSVSAQWSGFPLDRLG